ncbi:MAG: hypothetical protein KDB84_09060 [Flavobacteriales bacterium]|nr:hypothetical protein [Flavobacteriales bacterium]
MSTRVPCTLVFGCVLSVFSAQGGCGPAFNFAMVDSAGQGYSIPDPSGTQGWWTPCPVTIPEGRSFKVSVGFSSCLGSNVKLWKDGTFLQEWNHTSATWTTNEPGTYVWEVEAFGNMAPPLISRTFVLSAGTTTGLAPDPGPQSFQLYAIGTDGSGNTTLNCLTDIATDLHIELITLEGRVQHRSHHRIMPGENLVSIRLPFRGDELALLRYNTTEGATGTRKVLLH